MLVVRHTTRDLVSGLPTPEGKRIARQVITPLGPFDAVFSAQAKHCVATTKVALGDEVEVITSYPELDQFVAFHDELKQRAKAMGIDHGELWFKETPRDEVLHLIATPGQAYKKGIVKAICEHQPKQSLFILRGSGLEGLAHLLDPSFSPFKGWHFESCEGFWLSMDENYHLHLLSYVRRR